MKVAINAIVAGIWAIPSVQRSVNSGDKLEDRKDYRKKAF
jgi:hypothetical protein